MAAERVKAISILDREGRLVGLLTNEDVNEAYQLLSIGPRLTRALGQS